PGHRPGHTRGGRRGGRIAHRSIPQTDASILIRMPEPSSYRPATGAIPTSAGVYTFRDPDRRVISFGNAMNLRNRLHSYFSNPAQLHPRTSTMVHTANSVEWTVVDTDFEALKLEWTWITDYNPRSNVTFRDDKSYPYLA